MTNPDTNKVLFVDDDTRILNAFKRRLYKKYSFHTATGGQEGLDMIKEHGPYAVVISDQQMPGMDGVTFLKKVMEQKPMTVRMMLTGNADRETAVNSVNESNVFKYLNKPCSIDQLTDSIDEAVQQYNIQKTEKDLLEKTLGGSVKLLVDILAMRDPTAVNSTGPLRKATKTFADHLGNVKAWELDMAVMMAPIGEIALPLQLRNKLASQEPLNQEEQETIRSTPKFAKDLLCNIPRLEHVAEAIYYQNKAYDGSGFPSDEVRGDKIPINARILFLLKNMLAEAGGFSPDPATFDTLDKKHKLFDPHLLKEARKCFAKGSAQKNFQHIEINLRVEELKVGDVILENLTTMEGELALASANEITDVILAKIRQYHRLHTLKEPVMVRREVPVKK